MIVPSAAGSARDTRPRRYPGRRELQVQLPDADRRADEDLRGDVLEALMLDVPVPMTIDAKARDSFVTLIGTA